MSDRTPLPLLPGALSLVEARPSEVDIRISVPQGAQDYLRLGWREIGGQPTFRVVSGVSDGTVLTITGLEQGTEYDVRASLMTFQGFDLYRAGNSGAPLSLIPDGRPDSEWIRNLASGGLGKSQTIRVMSAYRSSLSIANVRESEDVGDMVFEVTLSEASDDVVTVDWTTSSDTAETPADYQAESGTLTFPAGEIAQTLTVTINNDMVDEEEEETFTVTLTNAVNAMIEDASATGTITDDDVPSVTASFGQGSYTVVEGSTVTVTLSADPERSVTIPITKANQGTTSPGDYSGVPANVTFNSGDTEETITFSATQDTVDDDGESVKLTFGSSLPTGVTKGSTDEAIVSITDDDVPSVTVSFEQDSYTVAEGSTVNIKVKLDGDPERTVTIPITATDQNGASGVDYSGVPASVTFVAGDTEETITFSATLDTVDDDVESVKLTFGSSLPTGVTAGTTNEATVTITDDDVPSVTVSFEQGSYTVAEHVDPERTVTIPITATDQDGASGTTTPGERDLCAGGHGGDDHLLCHSGHGRQDGEAHLRGLAHAAGTTNEATVTITDDDVPAVTVSFEQGSYTVDEGSTVTVKVKLDADPERTVTIPITATDQDEASGDDYSGVPASVTFVAGDTEETITFSATQDTVDDDVESVKLTFGSSLPTGVTAGTTNEATVTITDDDVPSVEVSFGQGSYTVAEGDTVEVTVTLSEDPERFVTIPLSTANQGGASDSDYSGVPPSVAFASGQTEKTFTFSAAEDNLEDSSESVKLSFVTLPDRVTTGTTDEATVRISNKVAQNSLTVTFELSDQMLSEGGTATVKVRLNIAPGSDVTIPLTKTEQGGASSADYSGVPANVKFASSETEKSFTFTAAQDTVDDDDESVKLGFGTLPLGVSAGSTTETTMFITDDDVPSVAVSFEQGSYTVDEGSTVTVKVKLDADPECTVTIPITKANQGGALGGDYSGVPASVTFVPGDTEVDISFSAASDGENDDGESVKLTFGALPDGVTTGSTDEATVSITDDDAIDLPLTSVQVSFDGSAFTVPEGSSVEVTINLSADPERSVTIPLTRTNQDGASNDDYSGVPDSVTFNSGETEKTFYFTATQDSVQEDGESVRLTFGALPDGVTTGSPDEATVLITDDDAMMEVSFERSDYSVNEGHGVEVMVTLDPAPDHRMDIQLQKTNMNGASDGDYFGIPSMLTFGRGETEKSFTFFAEPDNESDDGETVMLSFAALPAMVQEGAPSEATVTLRDSESLSQDGLTCIDNNRANIVTVLSARGEISSPGEIDSLVIPDVDPYRTYFVEILGGDSNVDIWGQNVGGGSLTLADPHPVSLFHGEWEGTSGTSGFNPGGSDGGTGHNARFIFSGFGDYVLGVESGDENGTGSYHVLVRYSNYCILRADGSILFPYEGGPEGYAFDVRDDTDTKSHAYDQDRGPSYYASGGNVLGDNWDSGPDEDWIRLDLKADTEYKFYLEADSDVPVTHQLTRPRIVGIYDTDGDEVHEGAAGSGTDTSVSLTFQPTSTGRYYLAVGSNPGDRTGLYSFYVRHTVSNNVGHAATNNSPTGGPGITGVPRAGEVLTATTSGIADADGLENASFSYQWVRHDPVTNTDTDIPGATGSTYTVTREDRDRAIKVRVNFTDDGGNYETLTSFPLLILPPVNNPATGAPAITGTAQVGEMLTADTSGIADADGLTNVSYSYQWIANDGTSDTEITSATDSTYTLVAADEGQTIKVKVSFADDADNEETLTSTVTAEVATGAPTDPPGNPRNLTGTANSDGTVTLRWEAPDDDSVTGYQILRRRPREGEFTLLVHVNDTGSTATEYTDNDVTPDVLHAYRVKAINAVGLSRQSNFVNVTPTQPAEPAQNSPATGTPTISGTTQVGETLAADTSGISDTAGLTNVSYSYQWIRNDGSTDTDIQGATGSSYTLVDVDEGKTIKVEVSFTDDEGNDETLSSGATDAAVAPEPPAKPTGLSAAVVSHDTVTLTWDNPQDDAITGYVILRRDREIHPVGIFDIITGDTGSADTTYTDDTVEPDKQYVYRIKAINEHGVSEISSWVRAYTPAAPDPAGSPPN